MALVDRPEPADDSTGTALDLEQVARFVDAAEAMGPRELALVMLFLGTGLRVSGIARRRGRGRRRARRHHDDHRPDQGRQAHRLRHPGRRRRRAADLSGRPHYRPLIKYREEWPSRQVVAHAIDRIARAAGLGAEGIAPHDLRHTFATLALDEGVTIRKVQHTLRRKDPRTTDGYDQARKRLDTSSGRAVTAAIARMTSPNTGGPHGPVRGAQVPPALEVPVGLTDGASRTAAVWPSSEQ